MPAHRRGRHKKGGDWFAKVKRATEDSKRAGRGIGHPRKRR